MFQERIVPVCFLVVALSSVNWVHYCTNAAEFREKINSGEKDILANSINSTAFLNSTEDIKSLERQLIEAADEYLERFGGPSNNIEKDARGEYYDNVMKMVGSYTKLHNKLNLTASVPNGNVSSQNPMSVIKGAMGAVITLNKLGLLKPITDFIEYEIDFLID